MTRLTHASGAPPICYISSPWRPHHTRQDEARELPHVIDPIGHSQRVHSATFVVGTPFRSPTRGRFEHDANHCALSVYAAKSMRKHWADTRKESLPSGSAHPDDVGCSCSPPVCGCCLVYRFASVFLVVFRSRLANRWEDDPHWHRLPPDPRPCLIICAHSWPEE